MEREYILLKEYYDNSDVDAEFILLLREEGLLDIKEEGDENYLPVEQLKQLEFFSHLYYDLSVNVEGIDIINNLLNEMNGMHREMNTMRRQLDCHNSLLDEYFENV
ncbi:chaperone modulator CbpM [Bacteroidales bacterium OttesenSCG-928-B11]|nr:chaperone modulator CbpM [Bacteroidales bacterium OttesenSCG-928-B11]